MKRGQKILPGRRYLRSRVDTQAVDKAHKLYTGGMPMADVGRAIGRRISTVKWWVTRYGWKVGDNGRGAQDAPGPMFWRCCEQLQKVGPCRVCGRNPSWVG
jgi:Putative ATPase subunit of terminase (gpP-like)